MKNIIIVTVIVIVLAFAYPLKDIVLKSFRQRNQSQVVGSEALNLEKYKGKPLVVNVFGSWCGACKREAPSLASAHNKNKEKIQFLGVAIRDTEATAKAHASKYGINFPIALDTDYKIMREFSIRSTPTNLFFDSNGDLIYREGPLDEAGFQQKIDSLD